MPCAPVPSCPSRPSISYNYDRYGPIGIVFVLLSWFIGFGVVMLGGAVVGAELWEVREHRRAAEEERAAEASRCGATTATAPSQS